MTTNQTVFNVREAAEYLRLAPGTLANWRTAGHGPEYMRRGRNILYSRESLDAWLAALPRYASTSEYEAAS